MAKSYYDKDWNWGQFSVRRNKRNQLMVTASFKTQELSSNEMETVKNELAAYFRTGPGRELALHSLHFRIL
jgi:hypothetical protein